MSYIENRDKADPNTITYIRDTNIPRRGIVDTSAILHKRELIVKYGEWETIEAIGYFHDWVFVKKWLDGKEKYSVHSEPTCVFMNVPRKMRREFFNGDKNRAYVSKVASMNSAGEIYFKKSDSSVVLEVVR